MADLSVSMVVDTESERQVYAYGGSARGEMFVLAIFRCPSCGSTGMADSWCFSHSAPLECAGRSLKIQREPVLVPHADPERPTTELYEREEPTQPLCSLGEGTGGRGRGEFTIYRIAWDTGARSPWKVLHPEAALPSAPADNEWLETIKVVPASAPNVLSREEARLLARPYSALTRDEQRVVDECLKRVSDWAEGTV